MEPGEALAIAAQIAIALAGFAGVVVAFRSESVHDWSPMDKLRLRLLLSNSILPVALSMLALLLLTVKPSPVGIWRWCSGFSTIYLLVFGYTTARAIHRLSAENLKAAGFARYILFPLGIGASLLQLWNVLFLGAFWPFFTAIVLHILTAMFQFVRLILVPHQQRPAS